MILAAFADDFFAVHHECDGALITLPFYIVGFALNCQDGLAAVLQFDREAAEVFVGQGNAQHLPDYSNILSYQRIIYFGG